MSGLKSLLADGDVPGALAGLYGLGGDSVLTLIDELLYGGQAWAFYRAIEAAKVQLSSSDSAVIDFRRPWVDLQIPVSRKDFEALIASDLDDISFCLQQATDTAKVRPEDVAFVTCTGGSSQIPAYRQMLTELYPRATTIERDPFTSVVRGLAEYAYAEWSEWQCQNPSSHRAATTTKACLSVARERSAGCSGALRTSSRVEEGRRSTNSTFASIPCWVRVARPRKEPQLSTLKDAVTSEQPEQAKPDQPMLRQETKPVLAPQTEPSHPKAQAPPSIESLLEARFPGGCLGFATSHSGSRTGAMSMLRSG